MQHLISARRAGANPKPVRSRLLGVGAILLVLLPTPAPAQHAPDWAAVEAETMEHFQALLRLDTSNPPGNETLAANYLKEVLEQEGIPVQLYALEPERANMVATLRGDGSARPLLLMGHTDVVTANPEHWRHPPFAAVREGGYVYGRGTLDDKDNVAASLMVMLLLKRLNVPLGRDVIFLAEAGEESTTRVGIDFMVEEHWPAIEAEYCLAEGGGVRREGGRVVSANIGTLEKLPRTVQLTARGPGGHGSVPTTGNAVARLASAVTRLAAWQSPPRLNETTEEFFGRLAEISAPDDAAAYRDLLSGEPSRVAAADEYLRRHSPPRAALLRNTITPTILRGGDRNNVIPAEASAILDVRLLPDEDPDAFLERMREIIDDPDIEVSHAPRDGRQRPPGRTSIDTDAFRAIERAVTRHYGTVTLPTMSTGATDMAQVRAMGAHCYGLGPATDAEDAALGFGAHGDQERIRESDLHDFVRFYWDVVLDIAAR
jgi:acetylornithine deacetylase/succinyl-diaminopimelate desuccinylase-like protein